MKYKFLYLSFCVGVLSFGMQTLYAAEISTTPVGSAMTGKTLNTTEIGKVDDKASRLTALNELLAEQWQYSLKTNPEFATILGDLRYNDQWRDLSLAQVDRDRVATVDFVKRLEAIDTTGFSDEDKLNKTLMLLQLKDSLEFIDLKLYEMPLNQMWGTHLQLPGFISSIPFNTIKDYDDYLARLKAIPIILEQATALSKQGLKDGLMPPKYLLEKVAKQIDTIEKPTGADSVFASPLKQFPDSVSKADRERLSAAILQAIDKDVRPAYAKLGGFVAKDYAPHGRLHEGIWSLPNGEAIYRYYVKNNTTTTQSPEQVHQLGLAEVKRIRAELLALAQSQGFKDIASFKKSIESNPKAFATSREQILAAYRHYIDQMEPELPKLFGLLPKNKVEVLPVERYREKEAAGAEYHQGSPDGSRLGQVFVNTGDFEKRTTTTFEATAYHEAVPGHHMQIDIAQNLTGLPEFRKQPTYTAYAEGWALYSEQLGKDIGFYKEPLSDYGRLSSELFRANRLVLDTGVHYKKWTRQQMVDFFRQNSNEDVPSIQAETDRYIAIPAQALAYKMGQLKILELRALAKQELGDAFDIRAFHDVILNGGALPLDVLESRTKAWIAAQKDAVKKS